MYKLRGKPEREVRKGEGGVFVISSPPEFLSKDYKENYDRFLTDTSDGKISEILRTFFNKLYAEAFSPEPGILCRFFSHVFLPAPCPEHIKYGQILDIGCSSGLFLSHLDQKWEKHGIEINKHASTMAMTRGLDVKNCAVEDLDEKQIFDVIRASHVIEHLPNPDIFFSKCENILRRGGLLVLYTPNSDTLSRWLFGRYWEGFYENTHFVIYNLKNLAEIAEKYHFKVLRRKTYYMGIGPGSFLRFLGLDPAALAGIPVLIFYILFFPISMIESIFNKGEALMLVFEKQ